MNITIIQTQLHWENKEANLRHFDEKINAIHTDTDLIILPEMFTTGFTMNAHKVAEPMNGTAIKWMQELSKKKNCVITGSLVVEENGKYYNRLIWMKPDSYEYYDKRHLFSLADEEKTYTAGNKKLIVEWQGWKICPLICYDLRFPVWSRRTKKENYDLLLYTANWPERRNGAWKKLLPARAIENQSYVIGVNRIGNDGNDIYHSGDSVILDYRGDLLSKTGAGEDSIETIRLSLDDLKTFREQFRFVDDADGFTVAG